MKKNFHIFVLDSGHCLCLLFFCHNMQQQLDAVNAELESAHFQGWVYLDRIFQGGNISRRFVRQYFDHGLTGKKLALDISDQPLRDISDRYIAENKLYEGSSLSSADISRFRNGL